jgi:hypothetical protein
MGSRAAQMKHVRALLVADEAAGFLVPLPVLGRVGLHVACRAFNNHTCCTSHTSTHSVHDCANRSMPCGRFHVQSCASSTTAAALNRSMHRLYVNDVAPQEKGLRVVNVNVTRSQDRIPCRTAALWWGHTCIQLHGWHPGDKVHSLQTPGLPHSCPARAMHPKPLSAGSSGVHAA